MEELSYTESNNELFLRFVDEEWDIDDMYTITNLAHRFTIDIRLARYYLMKLVDRGVLCQLKYKRYTYYMKRCWLEPFKRFRYLGVKLL